MSESTTNHRPTWNEQVIADFRAGEPKLGGRIGRSSLVLLTTTGARSGEQRTSPLAFLIDDDRVVIVASSAGSDKHPAWYFNILANPKVIIERWVGDTHESFTAVATVTEDDERERLFAKMVTVMPGFAEYREKTSRVIPVVSLRKV